MQLHILTKLALFATAVHPLVPQAHAYPYIGPKSIVSGYSSSGNWLVVEDFTGDARADIVAPYGGESMALFKNWGSNFAGVGGAFPAMPGVVKRAVAADFDHDGDCDLVVIVNGFSVNGPNKFYSLANNGAGVFSIAQNEVLAASLPLEMPLLAADLDRDGFADIVTGYDTTPVLPNHSQAVWRKNNGNGTFAAAVAFETTLHDPAGMACVDMDGNGQPDLVALSRSNSKVGLYRRNNDGTWAAPEYPAVPGDDPAEVIVADVSNDGRPDLIVRTGNGNFVDEHRVAVHYAAGAGFGSVVTKASAVTTVFSSLCATDADSDGDADIIAGTMHQNGTKQLQLFRTANGLQAPVTLFTLNDYPRAVRAADFDRDGDHDLVVLMTDGLSWLENKQPHVRTEWTSGSNFIQIGLPTGETEVTHSDIDRDGAEDLVFACPDYKVRWMRRLPNGWAFPQTLANIVGAASDIAKGDIDRNGTENFAIAAPDEDRLLWVSPGPPDQPWSQKNVGTLAGVRCLALDDIDADGDLDMAGGSPETGSAVLFKNDGKGMGWVQETIATGHGSIRSIGAGQAIPGGRMELFLLSVSGGQNQLHMARWNAAASAWETQLLTSGPPGNVCLAVADFDRSGTADVVAGFGTELRLYCMLNGAAMPAYTLLQTPAEVTRLTVDDPDRDGRDDLFLNSKQGVYLSLNAGQGFFAPAQLLSAKAATGLTALDTTGDGFGDLFMAGHAFDSFSTMESGHGAVKYTRATWSRVLPPGGTVGVLSLHYTHTGRPGDAPAAPANLHLQFPKRSDDGGSYYGEMTSAELASVLSAIRIYRDGGTIGVPEISDLVLRNVTSFNLNAEGELDVAIDSVMQGFAEVDPGESGDLLLVFEARPGAAAAGFSSLWVDHESWNGGRATAFTARGGPLTLPLAVTEPGSYISAGLRIGAPNALESWRFMHFSVYAGGPSATGADPDGDGVRNLVEYATHGNPTIANSPAQLLALPRVELVQNGTKARIAWKLASSMPQGIVAHLSTKANLSTYGSWTKLATRGIDGTWTGPIAVTSGPIILGMQTFSLTDNNTVAGRRFYRLEVEEQWP